jgi:hypothetical protein
LVADVEQDMWRCGGVEVRSALEWTQMRALAADGISQREIACRLGINRRTAARLLARDEPPRYRRAPVGSQLDPLEPALRRCSRSGRISRRRGWGRSSTATTATPARFGWCKRTCSGYGRRRSGRRSEPATGRGRYCSDWAEVSMLLPERVPYGRQLGSGDQGMGTAWSQGIWFAAPRTYSMSSDL